ncbi:CBS domain-containing protein [Chamaesiphon sp. VAR_48_metabat_403]|uniref:CBS domain-containing protein n=1 Tax=Chamaesiphon sp. VAR_48_metabat_403 TaxID=2964700 RepID=UPI00286DE46F|nr:CBS domain-containing protein [Chamaesiphon sp. VAR_48_metabat_403]
MDVILCHTTADFDALGAAVGLARLLPGSKIVLTGGAHPTVKDFLALYRDEYPTIERRSVEPAKIRSIQIVDAQQRHRLGKAAEWLDLPHLHAIVVYDHHFGQASDILATQVNIEPVGATTTMIVEQLQRAQISLTTTEATVMALGIHVDTGSLTYEMSTARDALALAWLMQQGANLVAMGAYIEPGLSPQLQQLSQVALRDLQHLDIGGKTIGWVSLKTDKFVTGLSSLVEQIRSSIADLDVLILAHVFPATADENRVTIIGRSSIPDVDLRVLFEPLGGGGHSQAAAASLRGVDVEAILTQLVADIQAAIPQPPTARDLMSVPIRTIRPETTIAEAQRILLRYGHSGLPIVDRSDLLIGIISRRDLDIALHHGFSHAPVKGYMTTQVKTIAPDTTLPQIEELMVTYDLGRLPVLADGKLVGIVTRTDVLRQLHHHRQIGKAVVDDGITPPTPPYKGGAFAPFACKGVALTPSPFQGEGWGGVTASAAQQISPSIDLHQLQAKLTPPLWELLTRAAQLAQEWGWQLYLVGGAVRDLLLATPTGNLAITDIDLVVDGFHQSADVGAGVKLATALQEVYPDTRLDIHGAFQTAALLWHQNSEFGSLGIDIATARTEFYPYPAANPEVEASSIRQDLYRRDFTINAMALRLTDSTAPPLLDFFGGLNDLQTQQVRVLHPNSFIEDPTRIYRGVRFAVRLGFQLEARTIEYIRYAIASGVYDRTAQANPKTPALQTRLKTELKYLLQSSYWQAALELLAELGALQCIHSTLELDRKLLQQLKLLARCLQRFDSAQTIVHWQLRLELIISELSPAYRQSVAANLQLPDESIDRLENLDAAQTAIVSSLPNCHRVSEVVQMLKQYDLAMLIVIGIRCQTLAIRRQIWRYLTIWAQIRPILTGDDLRKLGYKPGPQYRQMLDNLLTATLDGEVIDRSGAEAFIRDRYSTEIHL